MDKFLKHLVNLGAFKCHNEPHYAFLGCLEFLKIFLNMFFKIQFLLCQMWWHLHTKLPKVQRNELKKREIKWIYGVFFSLKILCKGFTTWLRARKCFLGDFWYFFRFLRTVFQSLASFCVTCGGTFTQKYPPKNKRS